MNFICRRMSLVGWAMVHHSAGIKAVFLMVRAKAGMGPWRLTLYSRSVIEQTPLQLHRSAVVLTPEKSIV